MIFLDTSAIYALADVADPNHGRAVALFQQALETQEDLLTHNYVLVESAALIQNRLGFSSAQRFLHDSQSFTVYWMTEQDHSEVVSLLEQRNRRGLSLVDCASFVVMRRYGASRALAFDSDFEQEGFVLFGKD